MNTYTPPRARQPEGGGIPTTNPLAKLNPAGARCQIRTGRLAPPLPPKEACSGRPIACPKKNVPPHVVANSRDLKVRTESNHERNPKVHSTGDPVE